MVGDLVPLPVAQAAAAPATVADTAAAAVATADAAALHVGRSPPDTTAGQSAAVVDQVDTAGPATSAAAAPLAAAATDAGEEDVPRIGDAGRYPRDRGGDGRARKPIGSSRSVRSAYTAGAGDSWYRIAEAAGRHPGALMDANLAGLETPIFPGDEICLPEGATIPEQLTTTTAPPASTTVRPHHRAARHHHAAAGTRLDREGAGADP